MQANTPVLGLTLTQAAEKMRGPVDTPIKLTIVRNGRDELLNVSIGREFIQLQSVRAQLLNGDIGYLRVANVVEKSAEWLKKAIADLQATKGGHLSGYILDLRNNSGGLFDPCIAVAEVFVEKGEIASTRGRGVRDNKQYRARGPDFTNGSRIVVLINGATASGAEIIAGALQDGKRATVIGTKSAGVGVVQTIFPLSPGNGALKLTTSRVFTPQGHPIEGVGLQPDIVVGQPPMRDGPHDRVAASNYVPANIAEDVALQYALNFLGQK